MDSHNIFYNPTPVLSHNSLFNFVLGARGVGKTYAFKKYCIEQAVRQGKQFIYLRRYKTELKQNALNTFFNDLNIPNKDKYSVKNNVFYYKDKVIGMALPLSTYISNKSVVLNKVCNIIYDEFIIDKGSYHYLAHEVETFLEFYFTIARFDNNGNMRNVRVFFLANAMSSTNPYFVYWNIKCNSGEYGIKRINEQVIVEVNENKAYTDAISKTNAYKIIDGTDYVKYAFNSEFLRDNYNLVEKMPPTTKYLATFIYEAEELGIYIDYKNCIIYVSEKSNPEHPNRYALTLEAQNVDSKYIKKMKRQPVIETFMNMFNGGRVRFSSLRIKDVCYNIANLFT